MVDFRKIRWFFTFFILLLISTSCAEMKSRLSPQAPVKVQSPETPVQTFVQAQSKVKQYVRTGEYQMAIDFYKAEYEKHPQDRLLVKGYVNIVEMIKTAADRASDRCDLASAGQTYNVLLKNYPDFKTFDHMLSFDRAQLNSRLAYCETALSKKGLQAYREGDLSEAISLWQESLVIDPNNTDVKKALNTAKIQQKNLRQTK